MHNFKKSSAVLAVFSSLMLLVALVVPVFAGTTSQTSPVTVPSGWTGVSAGTNQTGYPYRTCSIHLDTGTLSFKSVKQTEGYCAIRWDNQGTTDHQSYIELGIVNGGYVLKQGFDYILNLRIVCFPMGNPVTTTTVELGAGDFSMTKALSAGSTGVFEWEVRPDRNISLSEISLTISNNTTSQLIWVYPLKILETNPNQAILDGLNAGFAAGVAGRDAIRQQISDVGSQIDNAIGDQTDDLLNGNGLSGTSGVDDNQLNGAIAGQDGAQDKINDALGNPNTASQLDAAMNVQLDDNIKGSFSFINSLFSRVVTTLDISVVLTFLLVFALAMYVVGRRTS